MAKCVIINCKMIEQPIEMPCSKTNCRYFADCLATYEEYLGTRKPQTNADRIRAMSDEELAWELMTWRIETEAKHHGVESNYPNTKTAILEWLKQPVRE